MSGALFAFKTLVLVLLGFCSSFAQIATGCYEIRPASGANKRLTNVGGVLKIKDADNSDSQIFHIVNGGSGIAIIAQGSNQGFLAASNFNVGTPIYLKTTAEFPSSVEIYNDLGVPFWNPVVVNDGNPGTKYNMTKFNDTGTPLPVVGFGASNWGNGDPNSTATDIYLASANDMAIFGGAKWYLTSKACPSNFCDFNFTATVSNFNPVFGSNVLFSVNCQGAGCTGVKYHWVPTDARGYGTSRPFTAGSNGQLGPFTMDVVAAKPGCANKTQSVTINVVSGNSNFSQCLEAESSTGNGAITGDPNASNSQTRGLPETPNHYVDYQVTGVPVSGTYNVTLRYYSSEAPTVNVAVAATGYSQNVSLQNSSSWNIAWTEKTFPVSLQAGSNTIKISGIGQVSCRQDRICVNSASSLRIGAEEVITAAEKETTLSPNPSTGEFDVSFFLAKGSNGKLSVIDMQGVVIQERKIVGKGSHKEKVSLLNNSSGTYLIKISRENGQEVKKAVVIK
jgi:hypothetical protein